jgi:hypothetical protein
LAHARSADSHAELVWRTYAVRHPERVSHLIRFGGYPVGWKKRGRRLAAGIPGARFVPLESRNHLILEDEPAFPRFLEEIKSFLKTDIVTG